MNRRILSPHEKTLLVNLTYHALTRLAFSVVVSVLQLWFDETTAGEVEVWWMTALIISILASAASYFFCVRISFDNVDDDTSPLAVQFSPRIKTFPWYSLIWDFINLALLIILTGGKYSSFLPLLVITLLISDVCVERQLHRIMMIVIFGIASIVALLVNESGEARCFFISPTHEPPCLHALWQLNEKSEMWLVLLIFLAGSIFGSVVLERYVDRLKTRGRMGRNQEREQGGKQ